jgi:ABC-2 type transport system permease protein
MNSAVLAAVRAGIRRGGLELRQTFTTAADLWTYLFVPVALTIVMIFMRGHTVAGTGLSLGARTLPSVLGMGIAFGGLLTLATQLVAEREDGTLLRAKALPNGMLGYLIGKIVLVSAMTLVGLVLQTVPGVIVLHGFKLDTPGRWITLIALIAFGLLATLPLGAIIGSLFDNPRNMGLVVLPTFALVATSGIFYPITNFPHWLQLLAQCFPVYWLGLGMRSALLPSDLAAVEIGHSWRHLETFGMLGLWAVLGLVLAPVLLRRMARRESGSSVAERREKAMQQIR